MSAEETVVVVSRITHRHGDDISVYWDVERAVKAAAEYAREWWQEAQEFYDLEGDPPEDDQACVDAYFAAREDDEWFETREEIVR